MGSKTSYEILDTDLTLEEQLGWHLRGNHYPPAPVEMIPVCRDVILWRCSNCKSNNVGVNLWCAAWDF
jgi:hypothetical protein